MKVIHIDGSFCPHYKCGGWAFSVTEAGNDEPELIKGGTIDFVKSSYIAEAHALHNALLHILDNDPYMRKFNGCIFVSDNQNIVSHVKTENKYILQVNLSRKPPWDEIHKVMLNLDATIDMRWLSFKDNREGKRVHSLAKQYMETSRKNTIDKHAKTES